MKRVLCLLMVFIFFAALPGCSFHKPVEDIAYTELGIPSSSRYASGSEALRPGDMIIWEEKLYVGGGDYDFNAGPVDIWVYDGTTCEWTNSGTVSDEEINRFCVVNGSLIAPGIDPIEDWSYGNYYKLTDNEWVKYRNIPGGLHNFDMVAYNGMIFCGLGVSPGEFPIACSADGGNTFSSVEMYKDGELIDTTERERVRVYDLFVLKNTLYAAFSYGETEITYDLYRYENGAFVFDNQWLKKMYGVNYTNCLIGGKAEFKGQMFFTTGYLYSTADMAKLTRINFPGNQIVYDISVYNNALYVLCGEKKENGEYTVSVWKNVSGVAIDFFELFNFTYEAPPLSMACYDEGFYIGMGDARSVNEKNGMILQINFET